MARHQYGISAPISQTSFRGETTGGVTKAQASLYILIWNKKAAGANRSVRTGVTEIVLRRIASQIDKMQVTGNDRTRLGGCFLIGE